MLYCSCGIPLTSSRWHWSEFKAYAVSKAAHDRGHGTPDEVVLMDHDVRERAGALLR